MGMLKRQMRKTGRMVYTRPDGTWSMPNVLGDTYTVKVSHREYADGEMPDITCQDSGSVSVPDVSLRSGGTIRGTVLTKAGNPDGAASVMISSSNPGGMPFNWSGKTNVRGEFECRGLPPGAYRVIVHQREGQVQIFEIFKNQKNPKNNVSVTEGEVMTMELRAEG
jgi:hypothetical protein